ncbi:hypothetical protein SPBR_06294 [Sporothrix brasiliensis 5110]|uniref:Uncharacterized protein n=1 Tax=Sporothrix brasiliensis 5110 TaxID=1398154 RepID=A0A0C2JBK8_9PEZI|nr:uncharacterized protein SPBR_06294 [Sporothrix brasiliensis 5110]KIH94257.1 hypothetical protein SPBR_06294 [Sporothrix brasiliensis 5110]
MTETRGSEGRSRRDPEPIQDSGHKGKLASLVYVACDVRWYPAPPQGHQNVWWLPRKNRTGTSRLTISRPQSAKCLDWLDWDIVPTPGIVKEEEEG